jgi:hypothetical protein
MLAVCFCSRFSGSFLRKRAWWDSQVVKKAAVARPGTGVGKKGDGISGPSKSQLNDMAEDVEVMGIVFAY